jgi:hypothetical protein
MAFAYSFDLPQTALATLLKHLESNFGQAIFESVQFVSVLHPPDVQFVSVARPPDGFRFDDTFDPEEWERGRAFGEQVELRWRRRGDVFPVLIVSESPLNLATAGSGEIVQLPEPEILERVNDDPPLQMILWGEWQDPDPNAEPDLPDPNRHWWYEERIPRFLGYPWDVETKRLAIEVARYRASSESGGETEPGDFIYRFVQLRPVTGAQRPAVSAGGGGIRGGGTQ